MFLEGIVIVKFIFVIIEVSWFYFLNDAFITVKVILEIPDGAIQIIHEF